MNYLYHYHDLKPILTDPFCRYKILVIKKYHNIKHWQQAHRIVLTCNIIMTILQLETAF